MDEQEINEQVAEQICSKLQFDGRRFRLGEWVALLDGKVVGVGSNADEMLAALRLLDPNPKRGMLLEVGPQIDVIVTPYHWRDED